MKNARNANWKRTLLPMLAGLMIGTPTLAAGAGDSDSDERVVVRDRLRTCRGAKVVGFGDARAISLSPRAFLGVEASNLTPELREHFGVSGDAGVMLSKIVGDSAADAAGLAVGDIVTRVDSDDILSASRLGRAVRQRAGGDAVEIEYWRDGEMYHTTATLQERQRCSVDIGDTLRGINIEDLPEIANFGVEIGGEALEIALETLRETLANQDWDSHFEGLKEIDLERIEERMEHVQERLERMEERFERDFGREYERAEREYERARERAEREAERAEHEAERAEREAERELERAEREAERAEREAERELERAERERERAERERDGGEGDTF